MKIEFFKKPVWGTAIAVLCLLGVPSPINSPAQTSPDALRPACNSTTTGELPPNIYPDQPARPGHPALPGWRGRKHHPDLRHQFQQHVQSRFGQDHLFAGHRPAERNHHRHDAARPAVAAADGRDGHNRRPNPRRQPTPLRNRNAAATTGGPTGAAATEVTINYFYDTLAPYGSWVNVDGYGRCWRPSVMVYNPGWQPYCDHGHWVYTDCGWYWYSDYSWGWAPFHYGRWFQHPHWGWCWTPDTVWGPSWVTWRYSNGYCGWAPLPPFAVYQAGVGFFYRGTAVSLGFDWGLGMGLFHVCSHPVFLRSASPPPLRATGPGDADFQPDHGHQQFQRP